MSSEERYRLENNIRSIKDQIADKQALLRNRPPETREQEIDAIENEIEGLQYELDSLERALQNLGY